MICPRSNPEEDPTRSYEVVDALASDFLARYRDGQRPTIEEYARRHPDLASEIRAVFPLVLSVEQFKVKEQRAHAGAATLAGRQFSRLGDFSLIRELGRGGMGIVYEAEQTSLGRRVAVKILPKQSLLDDAALARFQREAKTAAAMHHSNIVPVFGIGESEGTHYLVMQLVRGKGLDRFIPAEDWSIDYLQIAQIGEQVADALAYAHENGVLHRDVKPANILIAEDGTAQITDFGIARNADDDPTATHTLSGSMRYMAPERFQGVSESEIKEADEQLRLALEELAPLRRQFPSAPMLSIAEVHIRHKLAGLARMARRVDEARTQIEAALAVQTDIVDAWPSNLGYRCWRALLYRTQAEIARDNRQRGAARNALNLAQADLATIDPASANHEFVVRTNRVIHDLADILAP